MKIEGDPKEIADFVLAVQGRQPKGISESYPLCDASDDAVNNGVANNCN